MMHQKIKEGRRNFAPRACLNGGFLLFVAAFLLVGCDFDRTAAVRELNNGLAAFSAGDSSEAVAFMEAALQADPTFSEAAYYQGQVYQVRVGDLEAAARSYRRALDIDGDNPRYAYRLGHVLAEQGDHEGAIRNFEIAVLNDPEYARAWFAKGLSEDAAGQFTDAIDSYARAIEINPRLRMDESDPGGEHYHALGDLYLRFRLFDHAAQVYENGARNNVSSPRMSHGHGVALMQLGQFEEAARSFEDTLKLDSRHGSANFNLAVAHNSQGNRDAAIKQLEGLLEYGGAGLNQARLQGAQALLSELTAEDEIEE